MAYVSVACGYSANIVLSTMDPLLAHTTQEAALAQTGYQGNTEPLCNYFFMSASTVVITAIVYWVTEKWLIPKLGNYEGGIKVEAYRPLSRKERRAIMISIVVAAIYVAFGSGFRTGCLSRLGTARSAAAEYRCKVMLQGFACAGFATVENDV